MNFNTLLTLKCIHDGRSLLKHSKVTIYVVLRSCESSLANAIFRLGALLNNTSTDHIQLLRYSRKGRGSNNEVSSEIRSIKKASQEHSLHIEKFGYTKSREAQERIYIT